MLAILRTRFISFDKNMQLDVLNSGVLQVGNSNELAVLMREGVNPRKDGYFYTYVTNKSEGKVNFNNLEIVRWAPKIRAVYDYYPFGLTWENPTTPNDPNAVHDRTAQGKELQFSEFSGGRGLALLDFHARMYDPALARWSIPDPAYQFSNPYLAMGNNPVIGVDPDGQWVNTAIGAVAGGATNLALQAIQGNVTDVKSGLIAFGRGAIAGALAVNGVYGVTNWGMTAGVIGAASLNMPSASFQINDKLAVSISPSIANSLGTGLGVSVGIQYQIADHWTLSLNSNVTNYGTYLATGKSFTEGLISAGVFFDDKTTSFSFSSNQFLGGDFTQRTSTISYGHGDFRGSIENDWLPGLSAGNILSDGWDRDRTGAFEFIYTDQKTSNEFATGFLVFTGSPTTKDKNTSQLEKNDKAKFGYEYSNTSARNPSLRAGIAYMRFNEFSSGWNHDQIRHAIQNRFIHDWLLGLKDDPSPWFSQTYQNFGFYSRIGKSKNPNTLWD